MVNTVKIHFFEMQVFWQSGSLNLDMLRIPNKGSLFCNFIQSSGLANENPGNGALGLPKDTPNTCVESALQTASGQTQEHH